MVHTMKQGVRHPKGSRRPPWVCRALVFSFLAFPVFSAPSWYLLPGLPAWLLAKCHVFLCRGPLLGIPYRRKPSQPPLASQERVVSYAPRGALTDADCERVRTGKLGTPTDTSGSGEPRGYHRRGGRCWSRDEFQCFAQRAGAGAGVGGPEGPPGEGSREASRRPTPELLAALARYRANQRRCFRLEQPTQVLASLKAGNSTACKYIFGKTAGGGLGNQMLALVSAFLYALLTDRVLMLEPQDNLMAQILCEPFEGEEGRNALSWLLPGIRDLPMATRRVLRYQFPANTQVNLSAPPPHLLQFHVHHRVDLQRYFCESFHLWARGSSALLFTSNMWWVPALAYVPHLRSKMRALFPHNDVFASLAPQVVHPNNRVWGRVTAWLQSLELHRVPPGTPLVGIQFRANTGFSTRQALKSTGKCLKALLIGQGKQEGSSDGVKARGRRDQAELNVRMYVATLVPEFREQLGAHMRKFGLRVNASVMTTDTGQQSADMGHNERAFAEMLGLALVSGILITSPHSTFGYAAAGFSAAKPWFLSGACRRANREPCFLIPPASVNCSPLHGVLQESENPYVLGSKNFRPIPLPLDFGGIPAGPDASIVGGVELRVRGQVIAGECPDTRWLRGAKLYTPPGLTLLTEWR